MRIPIVMRAAGCLGAAALLLHCDSSTTRQRGADAGPAGASGAPGGDGAGAAGGAGGVRGSGGDEQAQAGGRATGSAGASAAGGTATADGGKEPPRAPCDAVKFDTSVQEGGRDTDRFTWADARCEPRSAALIRAGAGVLRKYTYDVDGSPRVCTGTGANGWDGFGYAVNHYGNTAATSKDVSGGKFGPVFVGRHHAVYEYTFPQNFGAQSVPVTVHWMFATGRDHPVFAITYDASGTQPGSVGADTRSPYGDMFWEGATAQGTTIAGVGWGDRYKFSTTKAPLTMNSDWDYTKPNTIPYAFEWATTPDAEMGLVQTESYERHDGGGYWNYSSWGKTSATQTRQNGQAGAMPLTWNWTYQLDQYELCLDSPDCVNQTTGSHRLAWGANYGAIGGDGDGTPGTYAAYGDDRRISGFPYQSYSVYVVFGKHSDGTVAQQVQGVEAVSRVKLTATTGTVTSKVPGGVGRSDTVVSQPGGYDARYGTWSAAMAGGVLELTVEVTSGKLPAPILVVSGYEKAPPPVVTIDGQKATADADYYASVDTGTKSVWITFAGGWSGKRTVSVR